MPVAGNECRGDAETVTKKSVTTESLLTCPHCGQATLETMAANACQFFYECPGCRAVLRPAAGDCCVFCSYGSVKCPPQQQQMACCQ